MLFIYGLIVGVFLGAAQSIPDFMLFIFVGLMCWGLFAAIVTGSIGSVVAAAPLISKNRFPRILIPLAATVVAFVDFLIQGVALVVGFAIAGEWPSPAGMVYVVPALAGVILFGLAVGLVLGSINVYVRDVGFLADVSLQVGFWLCPILYSYGFIVRAAESYGWSVEWVTRVYMLNPMANAVLGFQRGLWPPASDPDGATFSFPGELELRLVALVIVGSLALCTAAFAFNRLARNFAQEF
jgi:ABC-2 type transport system permease protein